MKAGFGNVDITPRLGVEMAGFGPYRHRVATEVRDHLHARAMAVADDRDRWVLVSCDLLGVEAATVAESRRLISEATGLTDRQIMIHATHTHSGPATSYYVGWGEQDTPYMERLPMLIARAAVEAVKGLQDAEVFHAAVPVLNIAFNRDVDSRPPYEDGLREDWRPKVPEQTDRAAHVFRVDSRGKMIGFLSSYSCHPVVCCEATHSLHGDYAGVATNMVQADHPGCVGLFLQGCHGDINTVCCHEPQDRSMHALNVVAGRYARAIRAGLAKAKPLKTVPVASAAERPEFKRAPLSAEKLRDEIEQYRKKVLEDPAGDASDDCRLNTVFLTGMRQVLADLEKRGKHETPVEMQALRLGDLAMVATPFEMYFGIKERLCREAGHAPLLVMSTTNDAASYAPTRERFEKVFYTATMIPYILGVCPFTVDIEDEIVASGLRLLKELGLQGRP